LILALMAFFVFLHPDLPLVLHFQGVEEHVFHALKGTAVKPLAE